LSDFSILFFNIAADSNIQSWTKDEKTERKRERTERQKDRKKGREDSQFFILTFLSVNGRKFLKQRNEFVGTFVSCPVFSISSIHNKEKEN
jgi:hypothetical protein